MYLQFSLSKSCVQEFTYSIYAFQFTISLQNSGVCDKGLFQPIISFMCDMFIFPWDLSKSLSILSISSNNFYIQCLYNLFIYHFIMLAVVFIISIVLFMFRLVYSCFPNVLKYMNPPLSLVLLFYKVIDSCKLSSQNSFQSTCGFCVFIFIRPQGLFSPHLCLI